MSDYSAITSLSQLDPLTPAGTAPASDLDDAIRQVKYLLKTFLAVAHKDDGSLKEGAVPSSGLVPGSVRGGASNADAVGREIALGTISTLDLRDLAVATGKLADLSVTAAKIALATITVAQLANDAVETAKIKDANVTTAKLVDDAVTAAKLADHASTDASRAVTTNHLRDAAVTAAKIASLAVTEAKFAAATSAKILAGTGSGAAFATVGGALTATLSSGTLLFAFSGFSGGLSAAYALLRESSSSGANGGDMTTVTWNVRGVAPRLTWSEAFDPGDFIGLSGGGNIQFKKRGSYWVRAIAPTGATVGAHMLRFRKVNGTAATVLTGTSSAQGYDAHLSGIIEVAADNDEYQLQHWVTSTLATTGGGAPVSSGEMESYANVEIISLGSINAT